MSRRPGNLVANQDPGQERAKEGVGHRCQQGRLEGQAVGGQRARGCRQPPEVSPGKAQGATDQRGQRNEDDGAQVKEREAHREAKAGQRVELLVRHAAVTFLPYGRAGINSPSASDSMPMQGHRVAAFRIIGGC